MIYAVFSEKSVEMRVGSWVLNLMPFIWWLLVAFVIRKVPKKFDAIELSFFCHFFFIKKVTKKNRFCEWLRPQKQAPLTSSLSLLLITGEWDSRAGLSFADNCLEIFIRRVAIFFYEKKYFV